METEELVTTDKSNKFLEKLAKFTDIKLNIGSGKNQIEGFINIDSQSSNDPDLVHDITKGTLPFQDQTVTEICFFHCIEHIEEGFHDSILLEFSRVLKVNGILLISYPEFLKCADAYRDNLRGQREHFKHTIYGRPLHPGDFHVSLMDTPFFLNRLHRLGFYKWEHHYESYPNEYNSILRVTNTINPRITREILLKKEIFNA